MTTSRLFTHEVDAINTLPLTSTQVLLTLLNGLYAEPGFSDMDVKDIERTLEMDQKVVKGAVGHLTKLGLISPDHVKVNNVMRYFLYTDLHQDQHVDAETRLDGDERKDEAIALLNARLDFLNHALMVKGMTLAAAEATPTPTVKTMVAQAKFVDQFDVAAQLGVPVQQVSPVTEVKKPKKAVKGIVFKAGPGILNVMQFDDEAMRDSYGVTIVHQTKGYVTLHVRAGKVTELLKGFETRARGAADGWDQPLWYAASAFAAAKALRAAILEAK